MLDFNLHMQVINVHLQRYEMLIEDIEEKRMIVGDRLETQIVLNALRYAYNLAKEEYQRKMTRDNYTAQFGENWH